MSTTTQIVQQQESPAIEAYKLGLMQKAKELIEKGVTLPEPTTVDADPMTLQAQQLAKQGIGSFQPFLTSGSDFITGAGGAAQLAGQQGQAAMDAFTPAQQEAMIGTALGAQMGQQAAIGGMQGIQDQLAATNPYLASSVANVDQAAQFGMDSARLGQAGLAGTAAQYDPTSAQAFMDPYEDAVVQQALDDVARAGAIAGQADAARAVGAGAFGGSRSGIVDSERGRNILEQQAKTAAALRSQGFGQAVQQSMAAQEAALKRQQQAAGMLGQLGQAGAASGLQAGQIGGQLGAQYGQLGLAGQEAAAKLGLMGADMTGQAAGQVGQLALQGAQLGQAQAGQTLDQAKTLAALGQTTAGLGQLGQQMQMADVDTLAKLGAQQQVLDQAAFDAQQQYDLQNVYQPYQKLGFYSDILQGAPSTASTITQNTAPRPSMLNQVVGAGIGGLGIANAAQNVGII
tara:strand:- start:1827 stop:3200 length:1374 start_codon:yes stop_codon:yes gene_type:complete